jgi:hypothetical protein
LKFFLREGCRWRFHDDAIAEYKQTDTHVHETYKKKSRNLFEMWISGRCARGGDFFQIK